MTIRRAILTWALLIGAVSGCSTPRAWRSHHVGLLDALESSSHGDRRIAGQRAAEERRAEAEEAKEPPRERIARYRHVVLHWPLRHPKVTSPFGQRGSEFHEGIDLHARPGTPVYAATSGVVLYAASRIRGYGKMVIIRHQSGLATVYAHTSRMLVHRGQHVRRGQKIALSGATGHAHGPHLHFEVRDRVSAMNPILFLPKSHVTLAKTSMAAPPPKPVPGSAYAAELAAPASASTAATTLLEPLSAPRRDPQGNLWYVGG